MGDLEFGKADWRDFRRGIEKEWLVTNGLGGFAAGTIIGANARKYHGLLTAALRPPVRRVLLVAKLDERFVSGDRQYNLATNELEEQVAECGLLHLQRFLADPVPTFVFSFGDVLLTKQVFMVYGENTTVVLYRVAGGATPGILYLTPLVNFRDYHWTVPAGHVEFRVEPLPEGAAVRPLGADVTLYLTGSAGTFHPAGYWRHGFTYPLERERGEAAREDHYVPGYFAVPVEDEGEKTIAVVASTRRDRVPDGTVLLAEAVARREGLVALAGYGDPFARRLVLAADAFLAHRESTGGRSVIAGYPWFTDWGRDAMIALPGLTLVTKRYQEAAEILCGFARYCRDGLLPNTFPDEGEEPLYNTIDAGLWFFHAVYKYLCYTGDHDLIRERIYPVLEEIVERYLAGTRFGIGADEDGLVRGGSPGVQLTWMDAKVDGWVVTPRHGKPVEVNALWYNALHVLRRLAARYGRPFPWARLLPRVRESFRRAFWDPGAGYLYDVVEGENRDASLRPNQILALSLPYSLVTPDEGRKVLQAVWRELYATYGLRSLAPGHPDYRGTYQGDRPARDAAYHQGTVWAWLIGPFVTAYRRVHGYSRQSRERAAAFLRPFADHLRDHGVGFISEIFDGDEPFVARGCFAQAWSVAEVLRAWVEEVLEIRPPYEGEWEEKALDPS